MAGVGTKDLGPDELLEMLKLMDKLKTPQSPPVEAVSVEQLGRELDSQGGKAAITRAVRGRRKKAHWKEKKRKKRERMRPYMAQRYREQVMPKRKKLAQEGAWWEVYETEWKKRGHKIELTEAEWEAHISPSIPAEAVPIVFRFNTDRPIRLDNLMVKDVETKAVLFDGHDWKLRQLGAAV